MSQHIPNYSTNTSLKMNLSRFSFGQSLPRYIYAFTEFPVTTLHIICTLFFIINYNSSICDFDYAILLKPILPLV